MGQDDVMRLTRLFGADAFAGALESWQWLGVEGKIPVLASLFGDTILEHVTGYWFLDTFEGTLTREWANRDEVQDALRTEEGQDRYLLAGLAFAADNAGMTLSESEIYSFKVPPVLGGKFDLGNVEVADFVVSVNMAGQPPERP